MDNKTAFWFALIIVCIIAADVLYFEWGLLMEIFHLITRFADYLAFWRRF